MARRVAPPKDASDLAKVLSGNQPGPDAQPLPAKKPAADAATPAPLPAGKMGQACANKACKGKLTDLSRAHIGKSKTAKGRTLITLICDKCNTVQGQAEIVHPD